MKTNTVSKGIDMNDVHKEQGPEAVKALIDNAHAPSRKEALPLQRPMPEPLEFPRQALMRLEPVVTAIHDTVQAPYALCANSALAAACLAVQGHADIQLPVGEPKPLSLYFITIASSGERKSAADAIALKEINEKERSLKEEYELLRPIWRNKMDVWACARLKILKSGKGDNESKRHSLDSLGPEPKEPLKPLLTFPEPTYPGLHKYLERGQPSVGVFSAEGGQFLGGHAMKDDNKMETAAGFNSLWDGTPPKRVRSGDGTSFLYGRRVALHLMAQPETALKLMSDRQMEDQGFLARFLASYPQSTQGTRLWHEETAENIAALNQFYSRMRVILNTQPPLKEKEDNELAPRVLPLSPEARQLWIDFDTHLEKDRGAGGYFSRLSGLANKLPELATRLAGVLALYEDLNCSEVSTEYMKAGIELAQYYAQEALRLKDMQTIDKDLTLAQRILDWLKDKEYQHVSLQDVYQLAPVTEIRNASRARQIMKILVEHGHISCIAEGKEINGVHRKEVWEVLT